MPESWKPILGYEDLYEVSNMGRVRQIGKGIGRTQGRILAPSPESYGYFQYGLSRRGCKQKMFRAHRLVGYAFCNPPTNWEGLQINHKNGIRTDNRAENLEWCTSTENIIHARDILGADYSNPGEEHPMSKLTEVDVLEIRRLHAEGGISSKELGLKYGVHYSHIWRIVTRKRWKHV